MSGMLYPNKRFVLPAAKPGTTQEGWEAIFGSEEERKKRMKAACEETRERKKRGKVDIVQLVGDATDGFTEIHSEAIDKMCEQYRIPPALVKGKTREVFEKNAEILKQGGNILKDDK